jgi:hypothetical protein
MEYEDLCMHVYVKSGASIINFVALAIDNQIRSNIPKVAFHMHYLSLFNGPFVICIGCVVYSL